MDFRSDNVAGAAPEILAALEAANAGTDTSYGEDAVTARLTRRLAEIFEHEVAVFPVATGTAANALALSALTPPWGIVFCHEEAHVAIDECGAPEFFSGGAKLVPVPGSDAKIAPAAIAERFTERGFVHHAQPAAISISQSTEAGAVYRPDEVAALGAFAAAEGLGLHMDGARFANAVAALDVAPKEISWRAGVHALSFGATKNGALAAEAVIFFDPAKARDMGYRRKRGGHLVSKMRFFSAQLDAYLADDLWLRNARHANAMAARLGAGLARIPGARLRHPVEANEVFVELPEPVIRALGEEGYKFYRWGGAQSTCLRLVTSFATRPQSVETLIAATVKHCARANAAD
ncbi:MAG TPA: low specificity L-threonine aldolase [Stellaceae bacterium]|nr:low specificity L-threonine aldolase [Stellaceae bacterium]